MLTFPTTAASGCMRNVKVLNASLLSATCFMLKIALDVLTILYR